MVFTNEAIELINTINRNECFALTRWQMIDNYHENAELFDRIDSQDVWCFRGYPPKVNADFYMGVPGCDNSIAYLLHEAGVKLLNPSRTIRTYHYHISLKRTRNVLERIPKPYKRLHPHFLGEIAEDIPTKYTDD